MTSKQTTTETETILTLKCVPLCGRNFDIQESKKWSFAQKLREQQKQETWSGQIWAKTTAEIFQNFLKGKTRVISGTPFDEHSQCITIICRGRGGGRQQQREEKLQQSSLGQTEKKTAKREREEGERSARLCSDCAWQPGGFALTCSLNFTSFVVFFRIKNQLIKGFFSINIFLKCESVKP